MVSRAWQGAGVLACALAAGSALHAVPAAASAATPCPSSSTSPAAARGTRAALTSSLDLWGDRLLDAPGGPTAARAAALLPPLFYARAAHQRPLTTSGAYYLPFAQPVGRLGAGAVALHLADGSEIVSGRIGGPSLTIAVGGGGRERFGSCLARLATPQLASGYLPILETRYTDAVGAVYRQESFAARLSGLSGLVSFVRLSVDAREAHRPVELRFSLSATGLRAHPGRLLAGGATVLLDSLGGAAGGSTVRYTVDPGSARTVYVAFLDRPDRLGTTGSLARLYASARRATVQYWDARLAAGASVEVPDPEVVDAERALLVQNLTLGYRYSVGNAYQEFSFPETIDVARVMGEWGFPSLDAGILRLSLSRPPTSYPNWTRGEKLVGSAEYFDLFRDRAFLTQITPELAAYVATMARELSPRDDLLPAEHYSSDIPLVVLGLPAQSVVWQGLLGMASAWAETGHPALAARCRMLASWLHAGLERAVEASERRLADGSLFVPAVLSSNERPYASLTRSRLGSYWNLVMPYALASGLFAPGGAAARGILDYLRRHGALLLGLVRAGAYALYGHHARPPTSGTDEVYGTNLARFLAANGQADELVLALYGQLADGMTPGTFVAGEAASVAPLSGERDRAMYLPPNSAANAAFLETLRLLLVDETPTSSGRAGGLELGFATPRGWLRPGGTIRVRDLPTSFGPVSFTLRAANRLVRVAVAPTLRRPRSLSLRLRLPAGERIVAVRRHGRALRDFNAGSGTIDLTGLRGEIVLTVVVS